MRTSKLSGTIKIGDKSIPCTGTIEFELADKEVPTERLNKALRKLRESQSVSLSSALEPTVKRMSMCIPFPDIPFPFNLYSDAILAEWEYNSGRSYVQHAKSKHTYWVALYRLQGKHYPRERKTNQKRLAIVRRKMAREQSLVWTLPHVPGAVGYKIYGVGPTPITVRAKV